MINKKVQILRGIAIVYILILHSTFMWSEKMKKIYFSTFDTASGVELFFCIAGYYLAKKILSNEHFYIKDFFELIYRKISRLSPSL